MQDHRQEPNEQPPHPLPEFIFLKLSGSLLLFFLSIYFSSLNGTQFEDDGGDGKLKFRNDLGEGRRIQRYKILEGCR